MTRIALFGAGGKMGFRLASHLKTSRFATRYVEVSEAGRERLRTGLDVDCVPPKAALEGVEVVILAGTGSTKLPASAFLCTLK